MGNMSYCRYENTLGDLEDCYDALYDDLMMAQTSMDAGDEIDMSPEELCAMKELVAMCSEIARQFDIQVGNL